MERMNSLTVDLANPSSISGKLPEAEESLRRLEQELGQKQQEVAHWQRLVTIMQALEKEPKSGAETALAPVPLHLTDLQTLVVGVVNREVRKIRAKDVTAILNSEGVDITNDSVSNCLWYVAEKVEPSPIKRVGRGFYAPVAYKEEGLTPGEMAIAGLGVGALAAFLAS